MEILLILFGFILSIQYTPSECWNFCHNGKEDEFCSGFRHVVCHKDDIEMQGNYLSEAPMTYKMIGTLLAKLNDARNEIAGGLSRDGDTPFPLAAKMRALTWDNQLEFFALHRSNTCSIEHSACPRSPKYKQAAEIVGMFGQDTKPIRIAKALEGIFNDILNEGKDIVDKSVLGKNLTPILMRKALNLLVLANDKASRAGCGIVLCTDCKNMTGGANHPFCYSFTCVLDVVNLEGCPVYEISKTSSPGGKCSESYGKGADEKYPNLCANNGWLYGKFKCDGPTEYPWGQWTKGEKCDNIPSKRDEPYEEGSNINMPKMPQRNFMARKEEIEPLNKDDPDQLCGLLRPHPKTKTTLAFCTVDAWEESHLHHVACHYSHFEIGDVTGLYWPSQCEKDLILDMHNRIRDFVASGEESSTKAKAKFPSASRMRELIWDNELEWLAMWKAKQCSLKFSRCHGTKAYKFAGHNTEALSFVGQENIGLPYIAHQAIQSMHVGSKNNVSDVKNMTIVRKEADQFAQMVVDKASRVGCALSKCRNLLGDEPQNTTDYVLACFYDASTDWDDAYQTGPPTSECKSAWNLEKSEKYPNLCAKSNERGAITYDGKPEDEKYEWLLKQDCEDFGWPDCSVINTWPKRSAATRLHAQKILVIILFHFYYDFSNFLHF